LTQNAMILTPAYTYPDQLPIALRQQGYAVLSAQGTCELAACQANDLAALAQTWADLPPDAYLKDGGRYRRRRHSCFVVQGDTVTQVAHRAHWQPVEYNALHGGMQRWFEPMQPQALSNAAWNPLLRAVAAQSSQLRGAQPWYVEAHQFRIDTEGGIGRPTPEGAHRDGVDLVAVFLVNRHAIKGGETRVFEAQGTRGERFTLTQAWSLVLLDDARVIHESTPIQPLPSPDAQPAYRDTLVLTCRAAGFQGD
jgi:hypothetical protein